MKNIFICIAFLFFVKEGVSQTNSVNKVSVQLGYECRNISVISTLYDTTINYKIRNVPISANIYYAKFFETSLTYIMRSPLIIQQKVHITPFFSNKPMRLGLYIPIGLQIPVKHYLLGHIKKEDKVLQHGFRFGLGASFNLNKKWGVYGEYYIHPSKHSLYKPYLQFGVSYSWHTKKTEMN